MNIFYILLLMSKSQLTLYRYMSLAKENSSTLFGGTERNLLTAGSFYLLKKPQLPGGTLNLLYQKVSENA